MPLNFVALVDAGIPQMIQFYRMFSTDLTWAGDIETAPNDVIGIQGLTFLGLLRAMAVQLRKGRRRLLVGMHGSENHFPYPIVPGGTVSANDEFLKALADAAEGGGQSETNVRGWQDSAGGRVFRDARSFDELLAALAVVRGAGIDHLEFRGCNLGANPAFLRTVQRVLNAAYVVAPTVRLFAATFMTPSPNSAAALARRISKLGHPQRVFSRVDCLLPFANGTSDEDSALAMQWTRNQKTHAFSGQVVALSVEAVVGWTKSMLENSGYYAMSKQPPGGGYRGQGSVPLVGMWTPDGGPQPFVFPGDGFAYCQNLATSP